MTVSLWPNKDPDEVLDYSFDWGEFLNGDTISASDWDVEDGLTVGSDSFSDTVTTVWLSGGQAGRSYTARNRIVTAQGRTADFTQSLYVQSR